jgi:hypothetical protein
MATDKRVQATAQIFYLSNRAREALKEFQSDASLANPSVHRA